MGDAFCDGKVDILIEGLGNPATFYKKMVSECGGPRDVSLQVVEKARFADRRWLRFRCVIPHAVSFHKIQSGGMINNNRVGP